MVGLAFGLSWAVASMALFDFHEVALAVALAAYGLVSFWLITSTIIPKLSFTGRCTYWGMTGAKDASLGSAAGLVRQLLHAVASGPVRP